MNDNITLPWMNKIRERLKTFKYKGACPHIGDDCRCTKDTIKEFLQPIIEYGEFHEERISKEYLKKDVLSFLKSFEVKTDENKR